MWGMSRLSDQIVEITPDVLLKAYACGIFPMAESAEDPGLYWIEPDRRGIIGRARGVLLLLLYIANVVALLHV